MAEHTPTPWHIAGKATIKHGQDMWIGTMNQRNRAANAALIVRAVNSHDANEAKIKALVKALRACRDELVLVQNGSTGGIPNAIMALIPERIAEADAALALCEQDRVGGDRG